MDFWKPDRGIKNQTGGNELVLDWMVVTMVNVAPYLKCHPIIFQEESDEFPVPCVEALHLCINALVRFLF